MFRSGNRRSGGQALILVLEAFEAAYDVPFDHGAGRVELRALDGKTEQAVALRFLPGHKIPRQGDNMQAADGPRREDITDCGLTHDDFPSARWLAQWMKTLGRAARE